MTAAGRSRWAVAACVLALTAVTAAATAGCSSTVDGRALAMPGWETSMAANSKAPITDFALKESDFPPGYTALRVTGTNALAVQNDISGVPVGATANPASCTPIVADSANLDAIVGQSDSEPSTLTVVVSRPDQDLTALENQLKGCGRFSTDYLGAPATVTTELLPPPPYGSQTVAYTVKVTSGGAAASLVQNYRNLVGEVNGVRVTASLTTSGDNLGDTAALDQIFQKALAKAGE